jgi:hypothetical protein
VRVALLLLLQRPALAQHAGDPTRLKDIELPGVPLLIDVLMLL